MEDELQRKLNSLAAQSTLQDIINEQVNIFRRTDVLTNLNRREQQPKSLLAELKVTKRIRRSPSSSVDKKKKKKRDKKRKDKKHRKKRKYSSSSVTSSSEEDSGIGPQVPEDFY